MPLVSVLMAVHNDARFVAEAVQSVLRQTLKDLELIVVDDASTDGSSEVLEGMHDERVRVLRNDSRSGLAAALNRGLDASDARYVARLDSDDVARADRLERQVARMAERPRVAVVGSAIRDLDEHGTAGTVHRSPTDPLAVRWLSLFSSPFFHPTVLVDRGQLGDLRYDTSYLESEDYDLWTRLLEHADGANVDDALVLKRVHPGQASQRRGEVQQSFQRQVAWREIWRVGARRRGGSRLEFLRLLRAFEREHGPDRGVRAAAARAALSPRPRS